MVPSTSLHRRRRIAPRSAILALAGVLTITPAGIGAADEGVGTDLVAQGA